MGKETVIKYYHITYTDSGETNVLKTTKTLKVGRYYRLKDGREAKIVRQAHFKYTPEDLKIIYNIVKDYDRGTIQYRLAQKLRKAVNSEIPSMRFTDDEREFFRFIYYECSDLADEELYVISKILGINNRK